MDEIRNRPIKDFKIEFKSTDDYKNFLKEKYTITRKQKQYNQVTISINAKETGELLKTLKNYDVKFISEIPYTLEKHFKKVLLEKKESK